MNNIDERMRMLVKAQNEGLNNMAKGNYQEAYKLFLDVKDELETITRHLEDIKMLSEIN